SLCWFNPFIHLTLRELKLVHEFMADRYALMTSGEESDRTPLPVDDLRATYAEWLVWQSIGGPHPTGQYVSALPPTAPNLTNMIHSFYHTPLKRRIFMIMQSTSTRKGYLRQAVALPFALLICGAFAGSPSPATIPVAPDTGTALMPGHRATKDDQLLRFYI